MVFRPRVPVGQQVRLEPGRVPAHQERPDLLEEGVHGVEDLPGDDDVPLAEQPAGVLTLLPLENNVEPVQIKLVKYGMNTWDTFSQFFLCHFGIKAKQ